MSEAAYFVKDCVSTGHGFANLVIKAQAGEAKPVRDLDCADHRCGSGVGELGFGREAQPSARPRLGGDMAAKITPVEAETEPERLARLAWESRQIEEAREDLRAGRFIADEDVDAWLDRLVSGEPLPEDPPSTQAE